MTQSKETTMAKAEYVVEPNKQELTVTRVFDAPRELVFKCFTDAKLYSSWWGPRRYTNKVEKFDARSGGAWRIVQVGADGSEHGFHGVHHEVTAPERIAATFEYEGFPGHAMLMVAAFVPLGNKTQMIAKNIFESVADRDGMVGSGMQEGADESYQRLDDLLVELQTKK